MKTKQLATDDKTALSFVEDENFAPTKVNLRNKETGEIIHIVENGDVKVDEPKAVESVKKTLYPSKTLLQDLARAFLLGHQRKIPYL